ncbi:MAG: S-adenosyl-l-methionine hydroxide adenosyltransferase family protein [Candidatus Krumholzibacteriia bacterium]
MSGRDTADANPIAVLTDFGTGSFYVGALKGAIVSVDPQALIVDITHDVPPHAVETGSFILARVFDVFPGETVFLAVVDPGVGGARRNIVVRSRNRWLVAPDNGLVSDVAAEFGVDGCYTIRDDAVAALRRHGARGRTFLGRDVFAPAAAALAAGADVSALADPAAEIQRLDLPVVAVDEGSVVGWSRYVDTFGNVLSNITTAHVERAFGTTPRSAIRATVDGDRVLEGIQSHFSGGEKGALILIENSWGLLEIAANQGRAVDILGRPGSIEIRLTRADKD